MENNHYRKSPLTRSAWIGLAIFFLIFSCPVKKYIRLQLYKQHPLTETSSAPQQYTIKEIKDCSIADKHEQSQIISLSFLQRISDHPDLIPFYISAFLSFALLYFIKKDEEDTLVASDTSPDSPGSLPLYLRLRHLQVWYGIVSQCLNFIAVSCDGFSSVSIICIIHNRLYALCLNAMITM